MASRPRRSVSRFTGQTSADPNDGSFDSDDFEDVASTKPAKRSRPAAKGSVAEEDLSAIEAIVTDRTDPEHGLEYLVKWKSKSHWHNAWISDEYARNLSRNLVIRYEKRRAVVDEMRKRSYAYSKEEDEAEEAEMEKEISTTAVSSEDVAKLMDEEEAARAAATVATSAGAAMSASLNFAEDDADNDQDLLDLVERFYSIPLKVVDHVPAQDAFLVMWVRMRPRDATWESREELTARGYSSLINQYFELLSHCYVPDGQSSLNKLFQSDKTRRMLQRHAGSTSIPEELRISEHAEFLPKDISLHQYQVDGVSWLRWAFFSSRSVILADEMGLGKTVQCAAYLSSLFHNEGLSGPFLVVAPLSCLANWERELAKWCPDMPSVVYAGDKESRSILQKHCFYAPAHMSTGKPRSGRSLRFRILLTSYEHALHLPLSSSTLYHGLIVDEAHRLKSATSKLTDALNQVVTAHRVLLTGTPLQNNLQELLNLLEFLDRHKFSRYSQDRIRGVPEAELVHAIQEDLGQHLLRRTKKDVLTGEMELPPLIETVVRVDLSPLQRMFYRQILTKSFPCLGKSSSDKQMFNVVMQLRKCCNHPYLFEGAEPEHDTNVSKLPDSSLNPSNWRLKIPEVEGYLKSANPSFGADALGLHGLISASGKLALLDTLLRELRGRGHRVLCYSQMTHMLDILEDYCRLVGHAYERIDGDTPHSMRQVRIDRFNAPNSRVFIFLLSTRTGGVGINLPTADTVILYDSDWNPHMDRQALCRAHRIGQKSTVRVFRFICRNSVEERMLEIANQKRVLEKLVVRRNELGEAIRFGAAELFSKSDELQGTEEDPFVWMRWSPEYGKEDAIGLMQTADKALAEQAVVAEAEDILVSGIDETEFWAKYKVVTYGRPDPPQPLASVSDVPPGNPEENPFEGMDIDQILALKFEETQQKDWEALGKGKRVRRSAAAAATTAMNAGKPAKRVKSEAVVKEEEPGEIEEEDSSSYEEEEEGPGTTETFDGKLLGGSWSMPSRAYVRKCLERFGVPHPEREPDSWEWLLFNIRKRITRKREEDLLAFILSQVLEIAKLDSNSSTAVSGSAAGSAAGSAGSAANAQQQPMEVDELGDGDISGKTSAVAATNMTERFALLSLLRHKVRSVFESLDPCEVIPDGIPADAPTLTMYDLTMHSCTLFEVSGPAAADLRRHYAAYPAMERIDYALVIGSIQCGYGAWKEILRSHEFGILPLVSLKCLGRAMEQDEQWNQREYAAMTALMRRRLNSLERAIFLEYASKGALPQEVSTTFNWRDAYQKLSAAAASAQAVPRAKLSGAISDQSRPPSSSSLVKSGFICETGIVPLDELPGMPPGASSLLAARCLSRYPSIRDQLIRLFAEMQGYAKLHLRSERIATWNDSCSIVQAYIVQLRALLSQIATGQLYD
eukprot:ANDGO_04672.mRNA.1 Protein let-418